MLETRLISVSLQDRGTLLRERLGVTLGYKPLHNQQQVAQQRRASSALGHRGSTAGVATPHQAPYYYNQARKHHLIYTMYAFQRRIYTMHVFQRAITRWSPTEIQSRKTLVIRPSVTRLIHCYDAFL